jgi:hypothetical protein
MRWRRQVRWTIFTSYLDPSDLIYLILCFRLALLYIVVIISLPCEVLLSLMLDVCTLMELRRMMCNGRDSSIREIYSETFCMIGESGSTAIS